ncbi:MAG TPA: hypothetical protein VF727_15370 [Allosphingosinicella sp.]|jgi:hypothetical protein
MHWRRLDPVQPVGALIAVGHDAPARIEAAMAGKSRLLHACPSARGEEWIVLFAVPAPSQSAEAEALLPRLEGATPLYPLFAGLWLPVGTAPAVPDHVTEPLMDALLSRHAVSRPAVLVPRFEGAVEQTRQAALYAVGQPRPIGDWLAAAALASA